MNEFMCNQIGLPRCLNAPEAEAIDCKNLKMMLHDDILKVLRVLDVLQLHWYCSIAPAAPRHSAPSCLLVCYSQVPLNEYEFPTHKVSNVQSQLERLVEKNYYLHQSAKDAYRAYLLSYNSHALKEIFNVHRLPMQVCGIVCVCVSVCVHVCVCICAHNTPAWALASRINKC